MKEISDNKLPITEHFRELRQRVIYSLLAFLLAFSLCYYFAENIYQFLVSPLADAYDGANRRLIFTGLAEAFITYLKLAAFGGFIVSFPFVAWQVYAFVAPGLYKNEKRIIVPFMVAAPVLFILGAALVYYFIFPLAWEFFLSFEVTAGSGELPVQLEARVSEYLSLVTGLIMAFGLAFQLPLILIMLTAFGMIGSASLVKYRRHAIVGIFIIAAIITPPDVISQIGLAIPLMLLYECAVLGCRMIEKKYA